jgi:transposase-like protein
MRRGSGGGRLLRELSVVEQRYRAVLEALEEHATVVEVAAQYGVTRQTVHHWVRRYLDGAASKGWPTAPTAPAAAHIRSARR